jgi:hypothetical protein
MNTLNAVDIQQRGMLAIEEALAFGPVHIVAGNKPAVVVLRESDYQALLPQNSIQHNNTTFRWIMDFKPSGMMSKKAIDIQITKERNSWDD